jgi:hypothetical protein
LAFHLALQCAISMHMFGLKVAADPELGQVLFRCRPESLRRYLVLSNQGVFPPVRGLKFLNRIAPAILPIAETIILAGLPMVLVVFVLQVILGLKPPNEPSWTRPLCAGVLTFSVPFSVWWNWIAPRRDGIIVCERGFRWQLSLSSWEWLRSQGCLATDNIEAFSYRSDCFESQPVDCGKSPAAELTRILLELNLARHDIAFHLKNKSEVVVGKFFARFNHDDLRRFLDHLGTMAEPRRVVVPEVTSL